MKLMIGRASSVARPPHCPVTESGPSHSPVPLAGSEGETVQDFSYFFSYKTNNNKKNKKRRLGKDLGQRALKANISAEKQMIT